MAKMLWRSALILGLAHLVIASPLQKRFDDFVEKHSWTEIPKGWSYVSPAPADYRLNLGISLKQDKFDDLVANLMETSDPYHERYGQHLSKGEVETLTAPHPDSITIIEEWLNFHGIDASDITRSAGAGDFISVRVTVSQAENMLGAKYNVYHHGVSSERVVRTISYSLPRELYDHINVVTPTCYFGTMRSMRTTYFVQPDVETAPGSGCGTTLTTPPCLRSLYRTSDYIPSAATLNGTNQIGVAGYDQQYANRADLQTFFKQFRPDAVGSTYESVTLNGGLDDQSIPGIEADLDIQYTSSLTFPTRNIYYSTGGQPPYIPDYSYPNNTNEPYLDWLNYLLDQSTIPQVISTSYGDDEQSVPKDYATQVCNLFAQLGARGTTAFFASGDDGVGAHSCISNDGTNKVVFQPIFPASCPYVTTVGATVGVPEAAANFSGGGFSRYFDTPFYQQKAVNEYLEQLGTNYTGLYNPGGRGYPDISALASGFPIVFGGQLVTVGGTSASTPTVASIFSLLTDYRISQCKPSFGFLNPLLYSKLAPVLNEVMPGHNPACGTQGFYSASGWDPVTGLGTPDFKKLKPIV